MDSRVYKKQTQRYKLPIITQGQKVSENQEQIFANTIESQLEVLFTILGDGIYREGNYKVEITPSFRLSLQGTPSLIAVINKVGVYRNTPIGWSLGDRGKKYYCYINSNELTPSDSSRMTTYVSVSPVFGKGVLVAIVDDTNNPKDPIVAFPESRRFLKH